MREYLGGRDGALSTATVRKNPVEHILGFHLY